MIENLEQFLHNYGYFAVFIGTFVEGEIFLVVAGFFIKHHFLQPIPTLIFSILGALTHELIYFFLGRWKGRAFLLGNRYTKRKYRNAKKLINRYGILSLFIIRFLYGMRIVPMMLMGATGFSIYKFIFFNVLSLIIWSVLFLGIGYIFGHAAEIYFGNIKNVYLIVGVVIVLAVFLIYNIYSIFKVKKAIRERE